MYCQEIEIITNPKNGRSVLASLLLLLPLQSYDPSFREVDSTRLITIDQQYQDVYLCPRHTAFVKLNMHNLTSCPRANNEYIKGSYNYEVQLHTYKVHIRTRIFHLSIYCRLYYFKFYEKETLPIPIRERTYSMNQHSL